MKNLLVLFVFCVSFSAISQNINRENINGKIIVEGSDIEGVTIYNASSGIGTVTDEKGGFIMAVALNDLIEVRGLEYKNIDFRVNESILESKKMNVFLIEEINKLEEIIITTKRLTGNLKTDLKNVKTFNPKRNDIYFGIKNKDTYNFNDVQNSNIKNPGTVPQTLVNGLNIVNVVDQLLIPLFRTEVKNKKVVGISEVPSKSIKYYLGSNFLIENFNIPEHRVEEFIRYVEDETFDFNLLNYGHEIEFLELLSKKSKTFLTTKNHID